MSQTNHNTDSEEPERTDGAQLSQIATHTPNKPQSNDKTEPPPKQNIAKGLAMMIACGLFIGTSSVLFRVYGENLPELECAFFRGAIGFVILLILMGSGIKKIPIGNRKGLLFLRGFFGSVASMLYIWAIYHMEVALANGLNQTSPIFVCICASIFLRERFGWWIYLCVAIAFAGMTMIVSPDFSTINSAAIVAVLSAVLSAFAYTIIKKLQTTEQSDTIVLWFFGMSTLLPIFTIPFSKPWQIPNWQDALGLLSAGVTCLIGQQFMTRAYRYAPATIVAPFIYVSTLSTLVIRYIIWNELPNANSLLGCAIIIMCAIGIGILPKNKKTA